MTLPEISTRRLMLRPLKLEDASAIIELGGKDFEVARWMTSFTWPYEEGAAESFLRSIIRTDPVAEEAVFAITLGGVFIGLVSVQAPGDLKDQLPECPTVGYWIGRPFHGFGYATEAVVAALEWGFENHTCDAIAARAFEDNTASRGLLRKLGFKPYARTMRFSKALDRNVDNVVVRLARSDFDMQRAVA
ncbi:ribosomal-protein-alanine N-acetyltransferase [Roseibium sp. TrichSKD4]|uniref:GNAT family N-acetyltransferase n=1 Tax=Roseibium sp. TrichSKD4 TaxID=744980 RepID=UPI0001E561E6|nr:GNAT family N-acetyltransferase [Roseibium sp. TrichSKD4]EFO32950.1 ribosomal-protein-alanine N-acetyltransferase [Roseibium sp. TrichSKD4]